MSSNKKQFSANLWSNLPNELLNVILDQLSDLSDYIGFSLSCKHWLSAAKLHYNQWFKSQPPILLTPDHKSTISYTTHNISGKRLVQKGKLHVPINNCMHFRGSSHGWLIFLHDSSAVILVNPFTKSTIHLPPIIRTEEESDELFKSWDFKPLRIKKFVLSEDPSLHPDTYQVLALYSFKFVWLFNSRSENWVHVDLETNPLYLRNIRFNMYWDHPSLGRSNKEVNEDAIFYQGKFYITGKRWFFTVESDARVNFRRLVLRQDTNSDQWSSERQYLVESCDGCLLYIEKSTSSEFRVYEVDTNDQDDLMTCTRVRNLGGQTLFIGFRSFSFLGSKISRIRPGFIYYGDSIYDKDSRATTDKYSEDISIVYDFHRGRAKCIKLGVRALIDQVESPFWIVPRANLNLSFVAG